jgi:metacaspase-1
MSTGISVHIGLNRVDPVHYEGWDGTLAACEFDAKDMQAVAKQRGFASSTVLLTKQATAAGVTGAILDAAKSLKKGDLFFLTYSGHGGQVRDTNGDEEKTDAARMDETWVCYDRQLVDDELHSLWGRFKPGVRIVVLSDSCHSGTVTRNVPAMIEGGVRLRAMPRAVGMKVEKSHAKLYRDIQETYPAAERSRVRASVLLVSGCMDNQYSQDGDRNGLFTGTLKQVWRGGKFSGSYRKLRDTIVARMPNEQTPNYYFVGSPSAAFEAQAPFTI